MLKMAKTMKRQYNPLYSCDIEMQIVLPEKQNVPHCQEFFVEGHMIYHYGPSDKSICA